MIVRLLLAAALAAALAGAPRKTALDEYVHRADPAYGWRVAHAASSAKSDTAVLELTSQTWGEGKQVDRTKWVHWLTIVRPKGTPAPAALLFITGGANDGRPRTSADGAMRMIAETTGSVVAELRMVPNQPLVFGDDPKPGRKRNEDAIIAYTWRKYLETRDASWPLRLPMTKSAIRAMDAVSEFLKTPEGGGIALDKFFVSGASKRGWTTWTTAAVDRRVIGISPIVIDMLNVVPSFVHHYRAYGFWAPAVGDYYAEGLMDEMDNPRYRELMRLVEPYEYRERLTMPKLILNSAGDQFFLPDSWKFYWKELKGENHLRYVPNSDHSLRNTNAIESLAAFYDAVIHNRPRPRYSWRILRDGTIEVKTKDKPSAVKLWQANNPQGRDFRLEQIGAAYQSSPLEPTAEGTYVVRPPKAEKGFTAYFVELTFPSGGTTPFTFTSGVAVTPDTYPFGPPVKGQTKVGGRPAKK